MTSVQCLDDGSVYQRLFERQVARLVECGYPEALGWAEGDFRAWLGMLSDPSNGVLHKVGGAAPDHIPFLVVVPHVVLPIERQIERLVVAKKRGYAGSLGGEKFTNKDGDSTRFPYVICHVNDGATRVGLVTNTAKVAIERAGLNGLTVEEGTALAIHSPGLLLHHSLALFDTDYNGYVPELRQGSDGPTFSFDFLNGRRREERGVPSCGRRLFLKG